MRELLSKLLQPLDFVLKDPERNLARVKGLERMVKTLVAKALQSGGGNRGFLLELQGIFEGFEGRPLEEKKEVILKAKGLIDRIEVGLEEGKDEGELPLEAIKGIGPKTCQILRKRGIETLRDLLLFLPLRYEDRRQPKKFFEITPGQWVTSVGQVLSLDVVQYPKSGKHILEALLGDGTGFIVAKWFQGWDYLRRTLKVGQWVLFSGEVRGYFEQKEVIHPDIEILDDRRESLHFGRIVPVYSQIEGLRQKRLRSIMYEAVSRYVPQVRSAVPLEVEVRCGLPPLEVALREVHFPSDSRDLLELQSGTSPYHKRLEIGRAHV